MRTGAAAALGLILAGGTWHGGLAQTPTAGEVFVLSIHGAIGPATSDYVSRGIEAAADARASVILLEIDTPGGLDTSMREIIQSILGSPVPVASFVAPAGARAASAGTYILYASHIAAMAPATNLGAATPVAIGGGTPAPLPGTDPEAGGGDADGADTAGDSADETGSASERKAINDAVAYIRSLAERRGRNADWAESAVRGAASLSASAALQAGVIDLIAADREALLAQISGRVIDGVRLTIPEPVIVTEVEPDWRNQLLSVISNPTTAYMLMLLGIYGLIFEGYSPGAIVPGVVGAISLLLALFAFQLLPVNYTGLGLIILGVILITAEFFVPSFGALGLGGIAAFVLGSVILIDTDVPGFQVAQSLIAGIALSGALALAGTIWLALRARHHAVVSGVEEMQGMLAEALEDFDGQGPVWVHGERWNASCGQPVSRGQRLLVKKVNGLTLQVEPAAEHPAT